MFVLYTLLACVTALVYRGLPGAMESDVRKPPAPLTVSRGRVYLLATLFSIDAFGGGFVVQSLVALWLYQRHGVDAPRWAPSSSSPASSPRSPSSSRCASPSAWGW
jgi:hypothetical protein